MLGVTSSLVASADYQALPEMRDVMTQNACLGFWAARLSTISFLIDPRRYPYGSPPNDPGHQISARGGPGNAAALSMLGALGPAAFFGRDGPEPHPEAAEWRHRCEGLYAAELLVNPRALGTDRPLRSAGVQESRNGRGGGVYLCRAAPLRLARPGTQEQATSKAISIVVEASSTSLWCTSLARAHTPVSSDPPTSNHGFARSPRSACLGRGSC